MPTERRLEYPPMTICTSHVVRLRSGSLYLRIKLNWTGLNSALNGEGLLNSTLQPGARGIGADTHSGVTHRKQRAVGSQKMARWSYKSWIGAYRYWCTAYDRTRNPIFDELALGSSVCEPRYIPSTCRFCSPRTDEFVYRITLSVDARFRRINQRTVKICIRTNMA